MDNNNININNNTDFSNIYNNINNNPHLSNTNHHYPDYNRNFNVQTNIANDDGFIGQSTTDFGPTNIIVNNRNDHVISQDPTNNTGVSTRNFGDNNNTNFSNIDNNNNNNFDNNNNNHRNSHDTRNFNVQMNIANDDGFIGQSTTDFGPTSTIINNHNDCVISQNPTNYTGIGTHDFDGN